MGGARGSLIGTLAVVAAVAACAVAPAAAGAMVPKGPAGERFYQPPNRLLEGRPGTVIWARRAAGIPALPAAARTKTVIYRSRSLEGEPVAMSGTVAVPRGRPPRRGWPLVSWFHVTTGGADSCAPSLVTEGNPEVERMTRGDTVVSRLLLAGVAVARPDGEGIGTPGVHPYLIGRSLARSQIDIAKASRRLGWRVGRRWAPAGHSEGGVATLWSAALGERLAPRLRLQAAAAVAPPTRISTLIEALRHDPVAIPGGDVLSGLASLIVSGAARAEPKLRRRLRTGALSAPAVALLPHIEQRCLLELSQPDSWGGLAPGEIPGPAFDEVRDDFYGVLDHNDVGTLDLGAVPIRLDQGMVDLVVPFALTDELVRSQRQRGADITYRKYPTGDHANITDDGQAARNVVRWLVAELDRGTADSTPAASDRGR